MENSPFQFFLLDEFDTFVSRLMFLLTQQLTEEKHDVFVLCHFCAGIRLCDEPTASLVLIVGKVSNLISTIF